MPYAATDRQEFVKRLSLEPDALVLDLGGILSRELPSAISGITAPGTGENAVLIKPLHLPFRNSKFKAVISYHYFDLVAADLLEQVYKETARIMEKGSPFSFMTTLWVPQNESQRSTLFFNELLESIGAIFHHDIEDISRLLAASGFGEITVESVKREITIPEEFVRLHLKILKNIVKKEKGRKELKTLARQYLAHVKMHGEAILPAIHFTALKV